MRRPDEGLILQPVRVFARPRPKADIAQPRPNHFQPPGLTRYDAPMRVVAGK